MEVYSLTPVRLFYLFYFVVMGLMLPFFPVYLAALEFDAVTIGLLLGIVSAARMVAPLLFGRLFDYYRHHTAFLLCTASIIAAVSLMPLSNFSSSILIFSLLLFLFSIMWSGVLPAVDGIAVHMAEQSDTSYGRLRLWGSVGFVLSSVAAGLLLDGARILMLPWIIALFMLILAGSAGGIKQRAYIRSGPAPREPWSLELRRLYLASFFMQCSHGTFYGFFSLYLINLGYSTYSVGLFWVVGVIAEIALMWFWGKRLQHQALGLCMQVCFLLAAIRWLGIAYSDGWIMLLCLQLLHAASFGAFHVVGIIWVKKLAPIQQHSSAQGWYAAAGFGFGGMLGIFIAGYAVQYADIRTAFLLSTVMAIVGLWLYRQRLPIDCAP